MTSLLPFHIHFNGIALIDNPGKQLDLTFTNFKQLMNKIITNEKRLSKYLKGGNVQFFDKVITLKILIVTMISRLLKLTSILFVEHICEGITTYKMQCKANHKK